MTVWPVINFLGAVPGDAQAGAHVGDRAFESVQAELLVWCA